MFRQPSSPDPSFDQRQIDILALSDKIQSLEVRYAALKHQLTYYKKQYVQLNQTLSEMLNFITTQQARYDYIQRSLVVITQQITDTKFFLQIYHHKKQPTTREPMYAHPNASHGDVPNPLMENPINQQERVAQLQDNLIRSLNKKADFLQETDQLKCAIKQANEETSTIQTQITRHELQAVNLKKQILSFEQAIQWLQRKLSIKMQQIPEDELMMPIATNGLATIRPVVDQHPAIQHTLMLFHYDHQLAIPEEEQEPLNVPQPLAF